VELVDEHDRPVRPGTPSSSILVTNLYNHAQPLIRYRIEDRFAAVRSVPSLPRDPRTGKCALFVPLAS
jgi:phenylacetate-coenzyme A ligase PaaK-like adenylate-forming protein